MLSLKVAVFRFQIELHMYHITFSSSFVVWFSFNSLDLLDFSNLITSKDKRLVKSIYPALIL